MNKMKVRTNILIEKEILEKAKQLGLNISRTCENRLKLYINALENANNQILSNQLQNQKREGMETVGCHQMVGSPGFEPGIASAPGWYPRPN